MRSRKKQGCRMAWGLLFCAAGSAAGAVSRSAASQTVAPGVTAVTLAAVAPEGTPPASFSRAKRSFDVEGDRWKDTGMEVYPGERVRLSAEGTIALEDGRQLTPEGFARGWKDLLRQFPLNSANTGALIGRVSDSDASVPFPVGAGGTVTMPSRGELYLRANLTGDLARTGGSFHVEAQPVETIAGQAPLPGPPQPTAAKLVSPGLFADLPRRVTDANGDSGDMVNFALIGNKDQVEAAFRDAGWVAVDRSTQDAVQHALEATLNHQAYLAMPMSSLYLFERPQDLSYARADPLTVAAERHHVRVWQSGLRVDGRPLWIGSATHDIGFERDQRNGGTTHKIDPQVDVERSFLLNSFAAAGAVASAAYVLPANPVREAHTATGGSFASDGRIVVLNLPAGLK